MAKARKKIQKAVKPVRMIKAAKMRAVKKKLTKMNRQELKIYRGLLLKERTNLSQEMDSIAKDALKSQKDASGDLSGYTYHIADLASDSYDREFTLGLATGEQRRLFAIDEALRRIEDGSFGNCLSCGQPITKKRLQVVPYAALCIECQKSQEKAG